ncbi:unnamed protein product, partial [marine sediment metagenome]
VSNSGSADANDVSWSISVNGGFLGLINATTEETIDVLGIGESVEIQTEGILFGLGPVQITVTADEAEKTATGLMIGPFILNVT